MKLSLAPFRLSAADCGLVIALAALFAFLSRRPLWHTDLWGHLAYGRLIVADRGLPATEPLMPLSRGVPFVDLSWLSQVLGYAADRWQPIAAIQFLYAASITLSVGLLAVCVRRKTGRVWPAVLAASLYLWIDWQQFVIVRPQLAGCVCFVALFTLLHRPPSLRVGSLVVFCLFAAWVNLHGSFLVGLVLLATSACGRALDLRRRTGRTVGFRRDPRLRRFLCWLFVAIAGSLVNPYGWRIFGAAFEASQSHNLADLVEWQPLGLWMWQTRAALIVAIGLIGLWLWSSRRLSYTELFLLMGLGFVAVHTSRMIVWWAPVAAYYVALHAAVVVTRIVKWRARRSPRTVSTPPLVSATRVQSCGWSLVAGAAVCVAIAVTPLAAAVVRGVTPDPHASLSVATPIDAAAYVLAHPSRGQIFNTYEWGDYLLWAGPPGIEVFVASHAHLVPLDVWDDYMQVVNLDGEWRRVLDRYRINTIVLDDVQHAGLADALREDQAWVIVYEDERAVIFQRRVPRGEATRGG